MKRVLLAGAVLVIVAALGYAFFAWSTANAPAPEPVPEAPVPSVALASAYEEGVHEIEGAMTAPDACSTIEAAGIASGGSIRIDITLVTDEGVCLERPQDLPFAVSVEAEENAPIRAFVNGKEAEILPYAD